MYEEQSQRTSSTNQALVFKNQLQEAKNEYRTVGLVAVMGFFAFAIAAYLIYISANEIYRDQIFKKHGILTSAKVISIDKQNTLLKSVEDENETFPAVVEFQTEKGKTIQTKLETNSIVLYAKLDNVGNKGMPPPQVELRYLPNNPKIAQFTEDATSRRNALIFRSIYGSIALIIGIGSLCFVIFTTRNIQKDVKKLTWLIEENESGRHVSQSVERIQKEPDTYAPQSQPSQTQPPSGSEQQPASPPKVHPQSPDFQNPYDHLPYKQNPPRN